MMDLTWKEISTSTRRFQLDDEPEVLHIIKTGHENKYMVVKEDGYEHKTGELEFMTKEQIKERYKIDLDENTH